MKIGIIQSLLSLFTGLFLGGQPEGPASQYTPVDSVEEKIETISATDYYDHVDDTTPKQRADKEVRGVLGNLEGDKGKRVAQLKKEGRIQKKDAEIFQVHMSNLYMLFINGTYAHKDLGLEERDRIHEELLYRLSYVEETLNHETHPMILAFVRYYQSIVRESYLQGTVFTQEQVFDQQDAMELNLEYVKGILFS